MKFGRHGQLVPERGFSAWPAPVVDGTAFRSADGLVVCSSLSQAYLPGTDHEVGPQWHVSTSAGSFSERRRPTDEELLRVIVAFSLPAFEEDNHHPGVARHLWCPVDPAFRGICECKLTEITIVEPDGYEWTTEAEHCRGCEYERRFRKPCPVHR